MVSRSSGIVLFQRRCLLAFVDLTEGLRYNQQLQRRQCLS